MSYDIYIGQAVIEVEPEYKHVDITVESLSLPEAPSFPNDVLTGNGNSRHPGYSQWSEFTVLVGLEDLFFNQESGLMRQHPGNSLITEFDYEKVKLALDQWRRRYQNAIPQFSVTTEDAALARLIWLEWWMRWTLDNCSIPTLHNH